jgi:2-iminobutanoate/2-iminopropanoate deaminase
MTHHRLPAGTGSFATGGAYSAAVVAGPLCFVSGQLPLDPDTGELIGATVADQTRQVLGNVFGVLRAAGFSPSELVSVLVMLADADDWGECNDVYREVMEPLGLPSRMMVGAGSIPGGALVEMQCIASRSG